MAKHCKVIEYDPRMSKGCLIMLIFQANAVARIEEQVLQIGGYVETKAHKRLKQHDKARSAKTSKMDNFKRHVNIFQW